MNKPSYKSLAVVLPIVAIVVALVFYSLYSRNQESNNKSLPQAASEEEPADDKVAESNDKDKYSSQLPTEDRSVYTNLYEQQTIELEQYDKLLDNGFRSNDAFVRAYSIYILRKVSLSNRQAVSKYLEKEPRRKEYLFELLHDDEADIRLGSFIVLAATSAADPNAVDAMKAALKEERESGLEVINHVEMIRHLGIYKKFLNSDLKSALVDEVLSFQVGGSHAGPVLEAITVLSQLESGEEADAIFPYVCELYENEFYESPGILQTLLNLKSASVNCVAEMKTVLAKLRNDAIPLKQQHHKDWLIRKTRSVIKELEGTG